MQMRMAYIALAYKPYTNHTLPFGTNYLGDIYLLSDAHALMADVHPLLWHSLTLLVVHKSGFSSHGKELCHSVKDNCFVFMHCYILHDIRISRHGVPFSQNLLANTCHYKVLRYYKIRLRSNCRHWVPHLHNYVTLTSSILFSFEQVRKAKS